mgnify:CR=1 FL=1
MIVGVAAAGVVGVVTAEVVTGLIVSHVRVILQVLAPDAMIQSGALRVPVGLFDVEIGVVKVASGE